MDQIKGVMTKTAAPHDPRGMTIPEKQFGGQSGKMGGKTMKDLIEEMRKRGKDKMRPSPMPGKPIPGKPMPGKPMPGIPPREFKPRPGKPAPDRPAPGLKPMPGPGWKPGKPSPSPMPAVPMPGPGLKPGKPSPMPGKPAFPARPGGPYRPKPGPNRLIPMGKMASAEEAAIIEYAFNDELSKLAAKGTVFKSAIKAIKGVGKKLKGLGVKFDKQVQRMGNKISDKVGLPKVKSGIQNVKSGKTTAAKAAKSYRKRLAKRGRQVGYGTAGAAAAAGYGLKKALD